MRHLGWVAAIFAFVAGLWSDRAGAGDVIPHAQSRAPGPALSPAQAVKAMKVPPGFSVEIVASEPDLVNPVAMTFDERGRVWVTESLEYPRSEPGPGRDRVKVLEDTDGDGKADKFTVFAEGFNIPSGIAVGHGGVWVANSPDLLFLRDTDGDGKADTKEVVVTGFGRDDTHELPNSLTWGPDGWLYGWNGVFNRSVITYRGKTHEFTCAIFRVHPKTREFELFCEGTSNPWGITFDSEGAAFASACVIDHLWHLTESGYYHRQGGPYPPFTWKLESIADHKHQQAAYCGITYFDSPAYPPAYRGKLFLGNIHGNCVNSDRLTRRGSTYVASEEPDFLSANDAWFMPVSQKVGPDGSLYVLDWYDRYHCYQDARRDPEGIDRLKGRLYRVRYKDTPRAPRFDRNTEAVAPLVGLLASPNIYDRETAQRVLAERDTEEIRTTLEALTFDPKASRPARLHALWARIGCRALEADFHSRLLRHDDPTFRAWGVRAAGNQRRVDDALRSQVLALAADPAPDVRLQVAIAARKVEGVEPLTVLLGVLSRSGDDPTIPGIVWQNLHPLLADPARAETLVSLIGATPLDRAPALVALIPRIVDRLLSSPAPERSIAALVAALRKSSTEEARVAAVDVFDSVASRVQTGEIAGARRTAFQAEFDPLVRDLLNADEEHALRLPAARLAASFGHSPAFPLVRVELADVEATEPERVMALTALVAGRDPEVLGRVDGLLSSGRRTSAEFRGKLLASLGRLDDDRVPQVVLKNYRAMEPALRPKAVELLTDRPAWSRALVAAVREGTVTKADLNLNQLRKLQATKDPALAALVKAEWGTIRLGRNARREQAVKEMRTFLAKTPGHAEAGAQVFKRVCAQCHRIYGEGEEVGPEITSNGRGSYDQLLSNVFDPSLVIGAAFQATTVATADGRVLSGLLVEDSPQRVVLKTQGGKRETFPRDEIEEIKVSELSLMPEDLEKQLTPKELADLFAYLTLDKPPTDPQARPIPGAEELRRSGHGQ